MRFRSDISSIEKYLEHRPRGLITEDGAHEPDLSRSRAVAMSRCLFARGICSHAVYYGPGATACSIVVVREWIR